MKANFDFSGSNVMIIGGTSGINLGIAHAFADAGAQVGVASRSQDKVDSAVAELSRDGRPALGYVLDVRDAPLVAEKIAEFAEAVGPIDVLVSGAAGNFPAPAHKISPNGFKTVVEIDLIGTYHVMKGAYPHMRKPGGNIINVSAPQSTVPTANQVHVCAAKAGVDMVTKVLAIEWAGEGLRINGVVPGPIDGTEGMARLAPNDKARNDVMGTVPMGRFGLPSDVAHACLYLASDSANYVNGINIATDGGWLLNGAQLPS